jgi:hypothetical protein
MCDSQRYLNKGGKYARCCLFFSEMYGTVSNGIVGQLFKKKKDKREIREGCLKVNETCSFFSFFG